MQNFHTAKILFIKVSLSVFQENVVYRGYYGELKRDWGNPLFLFNGWDIVYFQNNERKKWKKTLTIQKYTTVANKVIHQNQRIFWRYSKALKSIKKKIKK